MEKKEMTDICYSEVNKSQQWFCLVFFEWHLYEVLHIRTTTQCTIVLIKLPPSTNTKTDLSALGFSAEWQMRIWEATFTFDHPGSNTKAAIFSANNVRGRRHITDRTGLNFDGCQLGLLDFRWKRICDIYLQRLLASKSQCYVNSTPVCSLTCPAYGKTCLLGFEILYKHSILGHLWECSVRACMEIIGERVGLTLKQKKLGGFSQYTLL